jgi:uncharacterized membrane protein YagU involved in acid resistance
MRPHPTSNSPNWIHNKWFQVFLYISGVVTGDLQGCMQIGVNQKLPPHPAHVGPLRVQVYQIGLDIATFCLISSFMAMAMVGMGDLLHLCCIIV